MMQTSKCEHQGLKKTLGEWETTSLNSSVDSFWTNFLDLKGRRKEIVFELSM